MEQNIEQSMEPREYSRDELRLISLSSLLKAVSHPARLCIVKKLYMEGSCNVGYFSNCMGISQSGVSQHLGKLRDLGIVEVKKQGAEAYYSLVDEDMIRIVKVLFPKDEKK